MRILAIDTSTTTCSVGLTTRGGMVETSFTSKRTHTAHLLAIVDDVLKLAGVRAREVDAFAVVRGPGTFTGLRIGISAAKGLAVACGKPLVGVSGLEALAAQCVWPRQLVCPMVDARRSEVYCACYRVTEGRPQRVSAEMALAPAKAVETIGERCLFVGQGALMYRNVIETALGSLAVVAPPVQGIVRPSTVARLAAERLHEGIDCDAGKVTPLYIRKSDAQLMLGKKQAPGSALG